MKWRSTYGDKFEWRRWFAWHPVYIDGYYYWLIYVERKYDFELYDGAWDYKLIK